MRRIDDTISNVAYILDSLMALRDIHNSGCCNDCGITSVCKCKPKRGRENRNDGMVSI